MDLRKLHIYLVLFSPFLLFPVVCKDNTNTTLNSKEIISKTINVNSCKQCEMVVEYFQKAMKKTEKYNFDGGNAAWQEVNLGPYANSETRLIEIVEIMCEENKTKNECLTLVENWEQHLEDWWFHYRKTYPSLRIYLCVETLKLCKALPCAKGWAEDSDEKVCADIDECLDQRNPCKEDEFCLNTQGSYMCLPCDNTCKGCYGQGPKCKKYVGKDNKGRLAEFIGDTIEPFSGSAEISKRSSQAATTEKESVGKYSENVVEKPTKIYTKVVAMFLVVVEYIPVMIATFTIFVSFWESPFIGCVWILCLVIYMVIDNFSELFF